MVLVSHPRRNILFFSLMVSLTMYISESDLGPQHLALYQNKLQYTYVTGTVSEKDEYSEYYIVSFAFVIYSTRWRCMSSISHTMHPHTDYRGCAFTNNQD